MTIQDRVREFILESYYVPDPSAVTDDVSLIDSGLVDSTGMLDLVLFLESEYGIRVRDDETTPDNLETISRIATYIARKQAETGD
jgi:acyl carrier protein